MDKPYHQIIPCLVLAQLPQLSEFFASNGHTLDMLMADAVRPDAVYKDSIKQSADIHHAHSYKLVPDEDGILHWKDGDCMQRVKGVAADIENWRANDDFQLVCRGLGEWAHYAVDCHTYPHLYHGKPWSTHHLAWEVEQAKWLKQHQEEVGVLQFTQYPDLYKAFAKEAREMYPDAISVVENREKGINMTDEENLALARKIAVAVGSGWITICHNFFPKE